MTLRNHRYTAGWWRSLDKLGMTRVSGVTRGSALRSFALASAAFGAFGTRAMAQARPAITVATLPSEAGAEIFYAQEMGYFSAAGLDVTIQTMTNGASVAAAVASGAVNIGFTTPISLALARQKGIAFLTVAPGVLYTNAAPFSALFVAKDSPIKTARELQGKVIAANGLGTLTEYGPRLWIDKNGGDATQVKFLELPFSGEKPAARISDERGRGGVSVRRVVRFYTVGEIARRRCRAVRGGNSHDRALGESAGEPNAQRRDPLAVYEDPGGGDRDDDACAVRRNAHRRFAAARDRHGRALPALPHLPRPGVDRSRLPLSRAPARRS
jgi:hypothetical protein